MSGKRGTGTAGDVRLKRAYEEPGGDDGYRVLVDRLWPRGVSKQALAVDEWMKEIGPSDALRRWFGHDPARWEAFAARYRDELHRPTAEGLVEELADRAAHGTVTLVYGAKDELHNQAVVLRDEIRGRQRPPARRRSPRAKRARGRAASRARSP